MPDRTQDLTNHRKVATACKNYTDSEIAKSEERMKWYIGEYTTTTSDDNTSASTKTVPSNATRCKIKRIYGLTQKFNPTTAYDDTSYMIKTMPATVYDFDVSKVEGASEVSENLLAMNDVAETTRNGIRYKIENGVFTLISGTASGQFSLTVIDDVLPAGTYYFKSFDATGDTTTYFSYFQIAEGSGTTLARSWENNSFILNEKKPVQYRIMVRSGVSVSNVQFKDMLVKGTTEPTTFKQGYEGIHNVELTGIKSEGANLFDDNGTDSVQYIGHYYVNGATYNYSIAGNSNYNAFRVNVEENTTYYIKKVGGLIIRFEDSSKNLISGRDDLYFTEYGSFTTPSNCAYIVFCKQISSTLQTMLNYGSTALDYVPYIAPTTKTIDLSSILYNGSPLFEGNSLKAVGTAKDYITPYVAHKEIGSRAYQSGDEEDTSVLTDGTTTLYELATPIEVSIDWSSTLRGITGYSNGTITLQNTYNMDTSNLITYNSIIKENCCAKIVQSRGGSVVKTINLPTNASDGYSAGSVNNVRDLTTNKRGTNVSKNSNMGALTWTYNSNGDIFATQEIEDYKYSNQVVALCSKFNFISPVDSASAMLSKNNHDFTFNVAYQNLKRVYIKATEYGTSDSDFKTAMTNEPLYYELADASKTETSIDSVDNIIEVQAGDELAFYDSNDNLVTVPSDLTYRIEVAN